MQMGEGRKNGERQNGKQGCQPGDFHSSVKRHWWLELGQKEGKVQDQERLVI